MLNDHNVKNMKNQNLEVLFRSKHKDARVGRYCMA